MTSAQVFDALLAEATGPTGAFGHREHLHLTWLAVRRFGTEPAIELVSDGIRRTARYAGAPQKYHATLSRAWVELVGYHLAQDSGSSDGVDGEGRDDFDGFIERHPVLLDKRLLNRHYRSATLSATPARTGWVEPDLEPLPVSPPRPAPPG